MTYARTADGHVYAWGFGENMQLGNGLGVDDETPSLLTPALLEGQALEVCRSMFCFFGFRRLYVAPRPVLKSNVVGYSVKGGRQYSSIHFETFMAPRQVMAA